MNKKIILMVSTVLLISHIGFSADLKYYRDHLPGLVQLNKTNDQKNELQKYKNNLRRLLSESKAFQGLDFTKGPFASNKNVSRRNRVYSSFLVKELLRDVSVAMGNEIIFGDDSHFNPESSILDIRKAQYKKYQDLILSILKKRGSIVSIPVAPNEPSRTEFRSGVSQYLETIKDWFVDKQYNFHSDKGDLDIISGEIWSKDEDRGEKVKLINDHLKTSPSKNGQNISDILGPVVAVSVVDSYVQRLRFSKVNHGDIPISLTALLSIRSGTDFVFLSTQQSILDYLQIQKSLLLRRKYYLENNFALSAIKSFFDWEEKAALKASESLSESEKKDLKKLFQDITIKQKYKDLYNKFYEEEAKIDDPNEKEFIARRLEQIELVFPVLLEHQKGALKLNQIIGMLSTEQLDYLIDLLIQLRGDDLLTPKELAIFGEEFSKFQSDRVIASKNPEEASALQNALLADFQFYSTIGNDLTSFQLWLEQKNRIKEGQKEDSNLIHEMAP